jgi:tight adherence protein C
MSALAAGLLAVLAVVLAATRLRPPRRVPSRAGSNAKGSTRAPALTAGRPSPLGWLRQPKAVVLALGAAVTLILLGPLPVVAASAAVAGRRANRLRRAARRREHQVMAGLAHTAELLMAAVAAGLTPYAALDRTGPFLPVPVGDAVRESLDLTANGVRLADALDVLPRRLGEPARPLARALASADRHGTALGPALDLLALDARAHRRRQAEEAARRLPVRLSFPLVCCFLPALVLCTVVPLLAGTLTSLQL